MSVTGLNDQGLRLLPSQLLNFIVLQVRIQVVDKKMHLIFFLNRLFLCICVRNTKGDAHKQCGPPKGMGIQFYLVYERT